MRVFDQNREWAAGETKVECGQRTLKLVNVFCDREASALECMLVI